MRCVFGLILSLLSLSSINLASDVSGVNFAEWLRSSCTKAKVAVPVGNNGEAPLLDTCEGYDRGIVSSCNTMFEVVFQYVRTTTPSDIPHICDLGCGNGLLSAYIAAAAGYQDLMMCINCSRPLHFP